ncbi:MAG TPA: SDR family oxidoreductase [Acidimicrobiales bacterium]|nr:SDR family oxidoreductase [Acidimicrobiales bacterium]
MPVAVVTGASGGVGRATAIAFAHKGFDVGLIARGEAGLEGATADVTSTGRRAHACSVDVADWRAVDIAASEIEDALGPIDVWVNDAMTTVFSPFSDVEPDDFARAVEVTFLGQVWGTRAALKRMAPRDRGAIVNVGSALAYVGIPLQAPYCASKFACRGFVESVQAELTHQRSRVRLAMVHLPAVNTPQFDWGEDTLPHRPMPVPPIYQPEVAADAIVATALTPRRSKVLGSWNKFLTILARATPQLAVNLGAFGAWEGQFTDELRRPDDPVNLYKPADDDRDFGAHGRFDAIAGGFLDPAYLKTLPKNAATLARAATHTARLKWRSASALLQR